jgi:hypothetical protein
MARICQIKSRFIRAIVRPRGKDNYIRKKRKICRVYALKILFKHAGDHYNNTVLFRILGWDGMQDNI